MKPLKPFIILTLTLVMPLAFGCGNGGDPPQTAGDTGEGGPHPVAVMDQSSTSESGNEIEYSVTGDLEAAGTELDVMICGTTEEPSWEARSLGDWVIGFEFPGNGAGEFEVEMTVGAPTGLIQQEGLSRDPRFRGTGWFTVKDAGQDAFGMATVEAEFSSDELVNGYGQSVRITGKFSCAII